MYTEYKDLINDLIALSDNVLLSTEQTTKLAELILLHCKENSLSRTKFAKEVNIPISVMSVLTLSKYNSRYSSISNVVKYFHTLMSEENFVTTDNSNDAVSKELDTANESVDLSSQIAIECISTNSSEAGESKNAVIDEVPDYFEMIMNQLENAGFSIDLKSIIIEMSESIDHLSRIKNDELIHLVIKILLFKRINPDVDINQKLHQYLNIFK